MPKMTTRIFIADPACVLPYGHNPTGVAAFTKTTSKHFDIAIPLVCKELPKKVDMPARTDRIFNFYYRNQIKLKSDADLGKIQRAFRRDSHRIRKIVRELSLKRLKIPLIVDPLRAQALKDWKAIFSKYKVTKADTIFFPCGDYYGVRGLFHYLQDLPVTEWPVIQVHLINVMEHACVGRSTAAQELFSDLLASGALGRRIFISTEVHAYAKYLSQLLMCEVRDVPFPPLVDPAPMIKSDSFTVAAIGSGRGDKGYFRLANIAATYANIFPAHPVHFAVQAMSPEHPEYNPDYEARLAELPNVQQQPHQLSEEGIRDLYINAHLLLLPYCHRTYQLRGSAVMSEGYGYGRPLLVGKDTAFESVIKKTAMENSVNQIMNFARRYTISGKYLWSSSGMLRLKGATRSFTLMRKR
jgi:hypothetical protein